MNKVFTILILLLFSNCQRKSSSLYFQFPCNSKNELIKNFEKSGLTILKKDDEIIQIQYPNEPNKSAVVSIGEFDFSNKICKVYYLSTKYEGLSFDEIDIEDMSENEKENIKEKFVSDILFKL